MTPSRKKAPDTSKKKAPKRSPQRESEDVADEAPVEEVPVETPAEDLIGVAAGEASSVISGIERIVAFHLAGQLYALPIDDVQEIQQIVAYSEVPSGGGAVVGMINLRGVVIPAVDLRTLIGLEREEYTLETPMVISRAHGELVALIVDGVDDVIELPVESVQPVSSMHALSDRILGVCQIGSDLIYLLDITRIITPATGLLG